jgi:hypothetical protein
VIPGLWMDCSEPWDLVLKNNTNVNCRGNQASDHNRENFRFSGVMRINRQIDDLLIESRAVGTAPFNYNPHARLRIPPDRQTFSFREDGRRTQRAERPRKDSRFGPHLPVLPQKSKVWMSSKEMVNNSFITKSLSRWKAR